MDGCDGEESNWFYDGHILEGPPHGAREQGRLREQWFYMRCSVMSVHTRRRVTSLTNLYLVPPPPHP